MLSYIFYCSVLYFYSLGRFQDEFVENRRQALEKCLNKIASHPILYRDPDLKLFLESDTFTIDVRVNYFNLA